MLRPTLFLLALLGWAADASIIVRTSGPTPSIEVADMPAAFGPEVPKSGLELVLHVADPLSGCLPFNRTGLPAPSTWVALMVRSRNSECTFSDKVLAAQSAGAAAAIVYDNVQERLIIMAEGAGKAEPRIPAVFVTHSAGLMMRSAAAEEGAVVFMWPTEARESWSGMLMTTLIGLGVTAFFFFTFLMVRRNQVAQFQEAAAAGSRNDEGMSAAAVQALPVVVYEPAGPSGESGVNEGCAICLEDYEKGEKLRLLPCRHPFHIECIDQWLTTRHSLCPVCKHDASSPAATERTPLLGSRGAGEQQGSGGQGEGGLEPHESEVVEAWAVDIPGGEEGQASGAVGGSSDVGSVSSVVLTSDDGGDSDSGRGGEPCEGEEEEEEERPLLPRQI